MHLLETKGLSMYFGGLKAIDGVDLFINKGEIVALIGPNGAGKTTFFNCVTGFYVPTAGQILWKGGYENLTALPTHKVTPRGLSRTFQNIRLFGQMTVLENVMVGRHVRSRAGAVGAMLGLARVAREEAAIRARAMDELAFVELVEHASELASNLPYGAQRRLEIARALATEPELLLLDEPAAGMNPAETDDLMELIARIRERGVTQLVIEHDMRLVMRISHRIYVLDYGVKIAEGSPDSVKANSKVISAYLGVTEEDVAGG